MSKEKEFTGVFTRDGKKIHVGDRVDTVQGTEFEVIKLEHPTGVKYALHDGKRPYDLESYMSANLWLVSACSKTVWLCGAHTTTMKRENNFN